MLKISCKLGKHPFTLVALLEKAIFSWQQLFAWSCRRVLRDSPDLERASQECSHWTVQQSSKALATGQLWLPHTNMAAAVDQASQVTKTHCKPTLCQRHCHYNFHCFQWVTQGNNNNHLGNATCSNYTSATQWWLPCLWWPTRDVKNHIIPYWVFLCQILWFLYNCDMLNRTSTIKQLRFHSSSDLFKL